MEWGAAIAHLLQPAPIALVCTAVLVVLASARRAVLQVRKEQQQQRGNVDNNDPWHSSDSPSRSSSRTASLTLNSSQALLMPLAASASLLVMFYLFTSLLSHVIFLLIAATAASSFAFCAQPYAACLIRAAAAQHLLLAASTIAVLLAWFASAHWLLNNLLAACLCISLACHIRLPNAKVCVTLLACLFFYDVFWVFFSQRFFGANVMVSVATQQAANPLHTAARTLGFPSLTFPKLDMPSKLVFPTSNGYFMLGLGDLAIPSMFLTLLLRFDEREGRKSKGKCLGYTMLAGYACGLVVTLLAGVLSRMAQPALLYLVPATLGPVLLLSWMRGELGELWQGPPPLAMRLSGDDKAMV